MPPTVRFCLALHNHQPVGNFDGVIEQAYHESYLPFLDMFENYPSLKASLHTSGCLLEWLDARHSDYVDRLADLVSQGRLEIIGGAFYEPILPMLPRRDRVGQITTYTDWLERRLGGKIRGLWVPERVWEASLVADLAEANIEYTILDDFHFRNAGLAEEQLHGYYLSEEEGQLLKVFPGSEPLRYLIPFGQVHETIDLLRHIGQQHPGTVVVFGDDGEKFGTWPETHKHVYQDGWLARFFDALVENQEWLETCTLSEAVDRVPPTGKIYLPDSSYREMTEWALPVDRQVEYEDVVHDMEHDPRWARLKRFVRGGFWRNFKVKYPESDEMYTRMLTVSKRLDAMLKEGEADRELLEYARTELYRGQCNCSYWHGAFGGIYLPHLRNAIYKSLIAADNLLDRAVGKTGAYASAIADDFNLDARQEVQLANDKLVALLAPSRGGQIYELDVRSICHNLLATMMRRPEAYHRKVLAGAAKGGDKAASIHDRVIFKQAGLDQRVRYDRYRRKSLIDHFYSSDVPLAHVVSGQAEEQGDFLQGVYETTLRKSPDRVQAQLARHGHALGKEIKITKSVTLQAGSEYLEVAYLLENLPPGESLHFGVEFNFAGLPAGADDRYFHDVDGKKLGHLGSELDLHDVTGLGLVDEWLGIRLGWAANRNSSIWAFPIETVSQSEGGFELVHQSVVVLPHWHVTGDHEGKWGLSMTLKVDTSLAESRMATEPVAVSS